MVRSKDISHETLSFALEKFAAFTRHDARCVLTPMLQHGQGIIDIGGDIGVSDDSDQSTHERFSVLKHFDRLKLSFKLFSRSTFDSRFHIVTQPLGQSIQHGHYLSGIEQIFIGIGQNSAQYKGYRQHNHQTPHQTKDPT
jgi:hypothetical protein